MRTDGTPEGTLTLDDVALWPAVTSDGAYFGALDETDLVRLFFLPKNSSTPVPEIVLPPRAYQLRVFDDRLAFFTGDEVSHIGELLQPGEIWFSDGTDAGTNPVLDFGELGASWLSDLNGVAIFGPRASHLSGLFRTDGTVEGTYQLTSSSVLGRMDGRIYIGSSNNIVGFTDGTEVFPVQTPQLGPPFDAIDEVFPPPVSRGYRISNGYVIEGDRYNWESSLLAVYVADNAGELIRQGRHGRSRDRSWKRIRKSANC